MQAKRVNEMSIEHKITATGRKDEGKGASRRLRHAARIPAIVYGGHADPVSIQLEHEKTWQASQNEWFYSSILSLDLDGTVEKVLLRDMQRHPYRQQIMHLDFQRVSENEAIRVSVPLHFLNEDKSPAGKATDVAVTHELTEVAISCLPRNLPEYLEWICPTQRRRHTSICRRSSATRRRGAELKLGADHDVAVVLARGVREEVEEEVVAVEGAEAAGAAADSQDEEGQATKAKAKRSNRHVSVRPFRARRRTPWVWTVCVSSSGSATPARNMHGPGTTPGSVLSTCSPIGRTNALALRASCSAKPRRCTSPVARSGCSSRPPT